MAQAVYVLDASIAVEWFVQYHKSEGPLKVLQEFLEEPRKFAVPELFFFELTHVLGKIKIQYPSIKYELLKQIIKSPLNRFSMSSELLDEIPIFQKLGLSGYDSSYVALAKSLSGVWLTLDKKAHKTIQHLGLSQLLPG